MELKKKSFVMLSVGVVLFVLGFLLTFFWMEGLEQGWHVVKAGGTLELSWYLQRGDRTEGFFNVTGGNEEVRFIIEDPSGVAIRSSTTWHGWSRLNVSFFAWETGMYHMIFENLDSANDQSIYVGFLSPSEPRFTIYDATGWLMMLVSGLFLLFGIHRLLTLKRRIGTPQNSSSLAHAYALGALDDF